MTSEQLEKGNELSKKLKRTQQKLDSVVETPYTLADFVMYDGGCEVERVGNSYLEGFDRQLHTFVVSKLQQEVEKLRKEFDAL